MNSSFDVNFKMASDIELKNKSTMIFLSDYILMFAMDNTIPNILFAVRMLNSYIGNSGKMYWGGIDRVMTYLKGYHKPGLVFLSS